MNLGCLSQSQRDKFSAFCSHYPWSYMLLLHTYIIFRWWINVCENNIHERESGNIGCYDNQSDLCLVRPLIVVHEHVKPKALNLESGSHLLLILSGWAQEGALISRGSTRMCLRTCLFCVSECMEAYVCGLCEWWGVGGGVRGVGVFSRQQKCLMWRFSHQVVWKKEG